MSAPFYLLVAFACVLVLPLLIPARLLGQLVHPLVAPVARSRVVSWLSSHSVGDLLGQLVGPLSGGDWEVTQAGELLARMRIVRWIVAVSVIIQWCVAIAIGIFSGAIIAGIMPAFAFDLPFYLIVHVMLVVLVLLSLPTLLLHRYYKNLGRCWREFGLSLCGQCGYIRDYIPEGRCPECGTHEPAVRPGRLPASCFRWQVFVNDLTTHWPLGLVVTAACAVVILGGLIGLRAVGIVVLLVTASIGALLVRVVGQFRTMIRMERAQQRRSHGP
jgi:hypothetical protein